jgi:hypothetical protein
VLRIHGGSPWFGSTAVATLFMPTPARSDMKTGGQRRRCVNASGRPSTRTSTSILSPCRESSSRSRIAVGPASRPGPAPRISPDRRLMRPVKTGIRQEGSSSDDSVYVAAGRFIPSIHRRLVERTLPRQTIRQSTPAIPGESRIGADRTRLLDGLLSFQSSQREAAMTPCSAANQSAC